jgi:uncharacterized coiled-coil protein SlyX
MSSIWTSALQSNKNTKPILETCDKIIENISILNTNVRDLSKLVDDLGRVSKDFRSIRNSLRNKREETQRIIFETKNLLQLPYSKEEKIKHDKLVEQFKDIVKKFEQMSTRSLEKEREVSILLRESFFIRSENSPDKEKLERFTKNLKELNINIEELDEAIISEQNRDIAQLEKDLTELVDCFQDIFEQISIQSDDLKKLEGSSTKASETSWKSTKEVSKASIYLNSARKKILIIVILILLLILILFLSIYLGIKK